MENERFTDENWKAPLVEHNKMTQWHWVVAYPDGFINGNKTDIGAFSYIQAECGVELGDRVEIGSHCAIYSRSTIDNKSGKVVIGREAKVGSHSTIMPGVTIGEGALIGAHSFVTEDIPAGCVAFGVPAKVQPGT